MRRVQREHQAPIRGSGEVSQPKDDAITEKQKSGNTAAEEPKKNKAPTERRRKGINRRHTALYRKPYSQKRPCRTVRGNRDRKYPQKESPFRQAKSIRELERESDKTTKTTIAIPSLFVEPIYSQYGTAFSCFSTTYCITDTLFLSRRYKMIFLFPSVI